MVGSKNHGFNSIFKHTSKAFTIKLANALFGFLYNILLAKQIGAEGAGIYYLAFSVNSISMLISEMGFRNVILRFVASYSDKKDWSAVKGLIQKTYFFSAIIASIFTLFIFLNANFIANHFFGDQATTQAIKYMGIAILPMTLILLSSSILKGLERYKEGLVVGGLLVPMIGIPLMFLLTNFYGVIGAVYSLVIVNIIAFCLGLFWVKKYLPNLGGIQASFSTKVIFATGLPLFMIAITNFVMAGGDVLFLGYWEEKVDVGVYGLAKRIAALTAFILVAINSIVAPKFSKLHAQGKLEELKSVAQNSVKLLTFFAFPAVIILTFFSTPIMNLVGKDFANGGLILAILAIGQFVNVITGSVGYLLMMSGHEKLMRNNILIVAVFTALLYYLLIPKFGVVGAAIASALGLATQNLIAFYLVKLKLGFWVIPNFEIAK